MKFDKSNAAKSDEPITAANYVERACAAVRANGGEGFVIRAIEGPEGSASKDTFATEPQWIAWLAYFDWKGMPARYLRSRGMGTVPAEWPEDFDPECATSDRMARLPRRVRYIGSIPKAAWQSLSDAIQIKRRQDWKPKTANLDELAERYRREPPQITYLRSPEPEQDF